MIQEICNNKVVDRYQNNIITIDLKSNNARYNQPGQTHDFNDETSILYSDFQHTHANKNRLEALSELISGELYMLRHGKSLK